MASSEQTDEQDFYKRLLVALVSKRLKLDSVEEMHHSDFLNLSEAIFNKTSANLSASTLKRLWGKTNYPHKTSKTTLNTLADFLGFENYATFKAQMPLSFEAIQRKYPDRLTDPQLFRKLVETYQLETYPQHSAEASPNTETAPTAPNESPPSSDQPTSPRPSARRKALRWGLPSLVLLLVASLAYYFWPEQPTENAQPPTKKKTYSTEELREMVQFIPAQQYFETPKSLPVVAIKDSRLGKVRIDFGNPTQDRVVMKKGKDTARLNLLFSVPQMLFPIAHYQGRKNPIGPVMVATSKRWMPWAEVGKKQFVILEKMRLRSPQRLQITSQQMQERGNDTAALYHTNFSFTRPIPALSSNFTAETKLRVRASANNFIRKKASDSVFSPDHRGGYLSLGFLSFTEDGRLKNRLIEFPIARKGFSRFIHLFCGKEHQYGLFKDLSQLETNISEWQKMKITSRDGFVQFFLNGQEVFSHQLAIKPAALVNIRFRFTGHGEAHYIRIRDGKGQLVFQDKFQDLTSPQLKAPEKGFHPVFNHFLESQANPKDLP